MLVNVDARGLNCPEPVIETKKELEGLREGSVVIVVDNEIAKENISKLASKLNFHFSVKEIEDGFEISVFKGELNNSIEEMLHEKAVLNDLVIVVGNNKLGSGDDDLGEILIKGYFYSLAEMKPYPKAIVFLNLGVRLTATESGVLDSLKKLADAGCDIVSCGTCLDYYGLKDSLKIGTISNMYSIVEYMNEAKNTIHL